jgi:hypothetical protein
MKTLKYFGFLVIFVIVIVVVGETEAHQSNKAADFINDWDSIVHDPLNPIINAILIISGFFIVVGIVKFKWFIKLRVTLHYGALEVKENSREIENDDNFLTITIILNTN